MPPANSVPADDSLKALGRDTAAYIVSKIVPGLAGLGMVLIFVRMIGSAEYGRYALAFATVSMAAAFFLGWMNQAVLRYYSRIGHLETTRRAIRVGLALSLLAGMAGIAVFQAVAGSHAYSLGGFAIVLALFAASALYQFRLVLFQAQLKPERAVILGGLQAVVGLVLPVLLFLTAARTYAMALLGLAGSYVLALLWRRDWSHEASGASTSHRKFGVQNVLRHFWRYGWALSFWFAANTVLPVSDRYFLQRSLGFEITGSYAALYDAIVRSFSLLLAPITMAAHPRMMRQWNAGSRDGVWTTWRWAMGGQVVASAGLFLVVLLFRGWVVRLIVPTAGPEMAGIVIPLFLGGFLWQVALLAHKPLEVAGKTRWMLGSAVVALGINLFANIVLLPRYGVVVPAVTTAVSAAIYIILCLALGAPVWWRE